MKRTYGIASDATPDGADVAVSADALYIGEAGNVAVTMAYGGDVTFMAVPAGTVLPVSVTAVLDTGTTAGDIIAMR